MNIKVAIPLFLIFSLVMQAYALQPQDDDNVQMHGVDAYGGAYGCTGYACNFIHQQNLAQHPTIPTTPDNSHQTGSPILTSMPIIPPTIPNVYAVIFGDSNPTYSNMIKYERVVVIGNHAYTMGASSDYYVRLNEIPLVSADTDQNTYVQMHGLNLVCCEDQAFSNLVNSGQGITWCKQFDGSDYCNFCDKNPTSSYCQNYSYDDYLEFCTKNPFDSKCQPTEIRDFPQNQTGQSGQQGQGTGKITSQQGQGQQLQQPQLAIPNTVYLIFPAIAVICIIYYVIGIRARFRNSRPRSPFNYDIPSSAESYTTDNGSRVSVTTETRGNKRTETTTEVHETLEGWNEEIWDAIKEKHPKSWEKFLDWICRHPEIVNEITIRYGRTREALYKILEKAKQEGIGEDLR